MNCPNGSFWPKIEAFFRPEQIKEGGELVQENAF